MNKLVVGYSGHSHSVIESCSSINDIKYYSEKCLKDNNPYNLKYIGDEMSDNFKGWGNKYEFILGVGDNKIRTEIGEKILLKDEILINIINPFSSVSINSKLGKGIFISKGVMINPSCQINNFVILNTGSIVEHHCNIEKGVHIAPGAVLCGNVHVGERSFIGANSVIKEGIQIGKEVIIGAGSVVLKDVPDNTTIYGNPAKI